jgi:hypothetical protein
MHIIYFFGPDGSGKSTQATFLVNQLRKNGLKTKHSWMRGSHTFVSILLRFLSKFDSFRGGLNPYYGVNIPKRMVRLWWFLEYISALPVILLRFVLPSFLGYVVVADRYVLDLVVWISLVTGQPSFCRSFLARHLISLALRVKVRFFVVADLRDLVRRSGEETSVLKNQFELYNRFKADADVLDTTNKSPAITFQEVLDALNNRGFDWA